MTDTTALTIIAVAALVVCAVVAMAEPDDSAIVAGPAAVGTAAVARLRRPD